MQLSEKDIQIMWQVAYKAFIDINKRFPNEEEMGDISKQTYMMVQKINKLNQIIFKYDTK